MTKLAEQIRKEIDASGVTDDISATLYDTVEKMSDSEIMKYLYVNKGYFNKMIPAVIESSPTMKKYMAIQPNWSGKVTDFDKMFNTKDFLDKYFENPKEWTKADIDFVAEQNGMTGDDLRKVMQETKIANDRKKIAHGEDLGGWFESPASFAHNAAGALLGTFGKRQQEAIERGEEPSLKDIGLDLGENVAYAIPYGAGIGAMTRGAIGAGGRLLAGSTIAPIAVNAADAAAYDDENIRGTFDPKQVGAQVGMNTMLAPIAAGPVGELIGEKIFRNPNIAAAVKNFGRDIPVAENATKLLEANQAANMVRRHKNMFSPSEIESAEGMKKTWDYLKQGGDLSKTIKSVAPDAKVKTVKAEFETLLKSPGTTFNEKFINSGLPESEYRIMSDAWKGLGTGTQKKLVGKSVSRVAEEEGLKNMATNKAGAMLGNEGWTRIPMIGSAIKKQMDEEQLLDENKKARREAERKYGIDFMLGGF